MKAPRELAEKEAKARHDLEVEVKSALELAEKEANARRDLQREVTSARELIERETKMRRDLEAEVKTLQNRIRELLSHDPPATGTTTPLRVSLTMTPFLFIITHLIPPQSNPMIPSRVLALTLNLTLHIFHHQGLLEHG
jgi:hypothetical protein